MAITPAQRTQAVTLLLQNMGNPQTLNALVPGLTPASLVAAIVGAIGTNFDSALTTCLGAVVAQLNANNAQAQASITSTQALITAATVV